MAREGFGLPNPVLNALRQGRGLYDLSEGAYDQPMVVPSDPAVDRVKDEEEELTVHGGGFEDGPDLHHDELTGEALPTSLVTAAREEECTFMESWGVWEEVPVAVCWQRTGRRPIGTRWVDVNKGDKSHPDVRCRLVVQEVNTYKEDAFFASTPPLEALRLLLSHVATGRRGRHGGRKVMVLDAKKAHPHAFAEREIYMELPPERKRPGYCGRLIRCLYGTRDAPALWERFLASQLEDLGFVRGQANSCLFRHSVKDLLVVVHGDDFTFAGKEADLQWVHEELEPRILLKKVGVLGGDDGDLKELRILNRVLRWEPWGIAYEADPRHAELLVQALGEEVASRSTPGVKAHDSEGAAALSPEVTRLYRAYAARANYLGMDRLDIAFAAKELCRRMSSPDEADLEALRRMIRYLVDSPRLTYRFPWQEDTGFSVYVDTDFAGCQTTRKSTSGGILYRGEHVIKHWSSTQKAITLSSGEAELGGVVKGVTEGLGAQALAADMGLTLALSVHADSSAAIGICRRSGIGRVRHLAVAQLWVQAHLRAGAFELHKVWGEENTGDILTKHLARPVLDRLLARTGLVREAGRAASAPYTTAQIEEIPRVWREKFAGA